jgi:hypothetical protein
VNEIERKVFLQLKKEKNLYPCEFGGGARDPIELLHCGFDYYKEIGIEEARELLLLAGHQFLKEINTNEQIRPYLATYPFKPENIQINIFLKKSDGSEIGLDKLHVISMQKGAMIYKIRDLKTERLTILYEETYEEAEARLGAIQL